VILCGFAAIVGVLTTRQVRGQFGDEMHNAVVALAPNLSLYIDPLTGVPGCHGPNLRAAATAEHAIIRIIDQGTGEPICASDELPQGGLPRSAPVFYPDPGVTEQSGYRVEVAAIHFTDAGQGFLLYARPLSDIDHTLARVRFFLVAGVLGGTLLALLAGLMTAQRAMRPVAQLTDAAREIELTRDPSRQLPHVEADDEIAELARTLGSMLNALDAARAETLSALDRQREFVADASHELRTPLTSVLANLELLALELDGEQAETAQAALRSTRRMRRLVADLLLLARADAKRQAPHRRLDLADVLVDVAAEIEPVAGSHVLTVDAQPAVVDGAADDLHRMVLNLIENSIRHTPPGTRIQASTGAGGGAAVLRVSDDGPGIPPELESRLFERFVRDGRDGGRGSGLGLAIVRAVADQHGGTVALDRAGGPGAHFAVKLPLAGAVPADPAPVPVAGSGAAGLTRRFRRGRA
jgi:signal transduction histidine kinase